MKDAARVGNPCGCTAYEVGSMPDIDVEGEANRDGLVVEDGWMPAELADCVNDASIQVGVGGLDDLDIGGLSLFVEVELEDDGGVAAERRDGVRRKDDIGSVNEAWSDDAGANGWG